jgi:hypothetical protein
MACRIETVRRELKAWRGRRESKREPVPIALRKRIVDLLEAYTWDEIGSGLRLSTCLISKWRREHGWKAPRRKPRRSRDRTQSARNRRSAKGAKSLVVQPGPAATFIEVPNPSIGSGFGAGELFVELQGPSQSALRLRGPLDPEALRVLAEAVIGAGVQP